ncbi:uncharacterized protein LOC144170840 [Haemaphysalis longicornis]
MKRTVYHLHEAWQRENHGPILDPLTKLQEKRPGYAAKGVDVRIQVDKATGCWAALVVTPIMSRTQCLESASEIIFVDSTASCDTTRCTVTVVLAATSAGAVPVATLVHNSQTTEGYMTAFGLLKSSYPFCFGGRQNPAAFMTDNSAAEKAALLETWPEARQLLCHFHVAQAEWRWLTLAKHGVAVQERKQLMAAFQKVMYADTPESLEAAKKELHSQQHAGYINRVDTFMEKEAEWVLLFRLHFKTRGHNTNNYSEASIRILKDIVLSRTKAYNVVALVEFLAVTWETYFRNRIIDHANSRVAGHRLLYEKLLKRLPETAKDRTVSCGDGLYVVPSGKEDGPMYNVNSTIGLCTCRSGQQGAFCKHQALVHKVFGGTFPNAPLLTREGRHELGRLALGDACPGAEFFKGLHENSSEPQAAPAEHFDVEEPLQPSNGTSCRPSSSQEIQENKGMDSDSYRDMLCSFEQLESLAKDNPACSKYAASIAKRLKKITNQQALVEALMRVDASLAKATRSGSRISVQPTSIARRRAGLNRGSKRVPPGRPPKGPAAKRAKRVHSLVENVHANVPSAK